MNSSEKNKNNEEKKPKSFIGLVAAIAGALGGFAALFVGFGYITITCFLSSVKLYGLAEFPLQFYREASIRLLTDIGDFFIKKSFWHSHWYMIIFSVFVIMIPIIPRIKRRDNQVEKKGDDKIEKKPKGPGFFEKLRYSRYLLYIYLVLIILIVTSTWYLEKIKVDTGSTIKISELIFFTVSLPGLISLFIYLLVNFVDFDYAKPFKTPYGLFFLLFIFLFIAIPLGYGSNIYDIYLYETNTPECDSLVALNRPSKEPAVEEFNLLFLMGHTSGREIFSYATDIPPRLILVDKARIKSITVKYEPNPKMSIRKLFKKLEGLESLPVKREAVNEKVDKDWLK